MCQESDISSVDQCEELGVEDDVDLEVQRLLSVYDLVKDDESRDRLRKFWKLVKRLYTPFRKSLFTFFSSFYHMLVIILRLSYQNNTFEYWKSH